MFTKLKRLSAVYTFVVLVSLIILSFPLGGIATEQEPPGNTLATVNGKVITLENFDQYWNMIPDNYKTQLNKEEVLEQIITQTLLIQKAEELNLPNDPEVAFQIKNTVDQILIQSLLEKEIVAKTELSEEDIQSYYEENKENYRQEETVHTLDILVETEEEAKEATERLNQGEDFSELAKEISIASSAANGGDIGFITKGTLMSEIDEQLFNLEVGEISPIIPIDKGFHIFKIIEKTPSSYLEFAEVKSEIENQLLPQRQQEVFDQYLEGMKEEATIDKNTDLLKDQEKSE